MKKTYPITLALILCAGAAWADESGAATLRPHTCLNMETGAASCAGADIFWDGTALTAQGAAALYNLGKYGSRVFRAIHARNAASASYGSEPIPASALAPGEIFGVRTNLGHYAKVIVAGADRGSIALEYTTFLPAKPAAAGSAPGITRVQNNYSYILPGLPNYGIAPGSIFVIIGSGLSSSAPAVLQSSAAPGLPITLNQTTISVTVNGVTTTPALYYTSATQIAAVLPSNTPAGSGTVTVTYNGQTSAAAPIHVVASAPGLDTLYGTGNGAGVATDSNGNILGLTNSAMPNQIVSLWGSGIGADPNNDDRIFPQKQNNLTNVSARVFIGGISATIMFSGRSQYPGLDQYNVVIPANVTPGCFVSAVVQTGTVVSNAVTLPVQPGGGVCTDPASGMNGTQITALANKAGGSVNAMLLGVIQNIDNGNFQVAALPLPLSSAYFGNGYEYVSQGSCTTVPPQQGPFAAIGQPLDAGTIQATTPGGPVTVQGVTPVPAAAGTYTFSNSGGSDIGKFNAAVTLSAPLTLTNAAALAFVTRSAGATVTWSGGLPNGTVQVEGDVGGPYGTMRFYCYAPSSAGQIAIPASILLAMPTGSGNVAISNAAGTPVSATGLDVGFAVSLVTIHKLDTVFK